MADITIIVRPVGRSRFEARIEGQKKVLCTAGSPLLASARLLAARALHDPEATLYMRHEGREDWALRGKLAALAKVSIVERGGGDRSLREEQWEPWGE